MQFSRSSRWTDRRWYLGVRCKKCKAPILFGLDPTEGQGPLAPTGNLVLTCRDTQCGHRADYSSAHVFQHQNNPQPAG